MTLRDQHVYILTPTDAVRIRELLSLYSAAIDRIFDRSETVIAQNTDEIMEDIDFYIKCAKPMEVDLDPF